MFQASDSKQKGAALADLLHLLPVPLQQVGEGGALAERLAMGPQRVQFGFPAPHPFAGQRAAIRRLRPGVHARALPVDADLGGVP
jgi:hypothetical protein